MYKHTPGPWTIEKDEMGYSVYAEDALICDMPPFSYDPDERLPNAKLIAAAPDLLNILKRISRAHDSGNNGAYMGEAVLCPMFSEMARAAIAKATGGKK